jgi:hypothetical protein
MTKPGIPQLVFWTLATVTVLFLGFFIALLAGAIPIGPPPLPPDTGAIAASPANPAAQPAATTVAKRVRQTTATSADVPVKAPTELATVVVTAARGDCWISARLGSSTGKVLEERLLAQGESVELRGPRVWLSIGASGNVDVTVNGEQRELQSGTVAVVLGPT